MTAVTHKRSLCDTATYASRCDTGGSCEISNFGGNNHKYRPAPMVTVGYSDARRLFRPADFPQLVPDSRRLGATEAPAERGSRPPTDVRERARRYVATIPPAVAGQHGDAATFRVCCRLVRGFALDDQDALEVLREWNDACSPPWSEEELRAKLEGARRYGREPVGGLLAATPGNP